MALQKVDIDTPQPGGRFGDPTRTAWRKHNENLDEIELLVDGAEQSGAAAAARVAELEGSLSDAAYLPAASFASASQGVKAESAVQPDQLAATASALRLDIDALASAQQTSAIYADTLAALQVVVGTFEGQGAFVNNGAGAGQYIWTGSTWQFSRPDMLASKLDVATVPQVQAQVRESIGIASVISAPGGGSAECIRDAAGNLRVVSDYPGQASGDPVFHGNVPRAWTAPAFGYDTLIESAAGSDPDRLELIRDVSGALRVMVVLGAQSAGPVFYGGNSGEARALPTEYVVFLIAGQSNAQGIGNPTLSPRIPDGIAFQYYDGALTAVTADPIGNADKASAWAAFANEFHGRTGMGVIFVPAAVGNSALTAAAARPEVGGNWQSWDASGSLRGAATAALAAAFSAATSEHLAWRFGGVLWSQGERDSHCLPNAETYAGVITEADYLNAFDSLITYLNSQIGSSKWPFLMCQTGGDAQGVDAEALASMRALQRTISGSRPQVRLAWTGAFNLIERGLMRAKDFPGDTPDRNRNHYSQQGYNEMGRALAVVAAVASI